MAILATICEPPPPALGPVDDEHGPHSGVTIFCEQYRWLHTQPVLLVFTSPSTRMVRLDTMLLLVLANPRVVHPSRSRCAHKSQRFRVSDGQVKDGGLKILPL